MKGRRIKGFVVAGLKAFSREKSGVFWIIGWPILLLLLTAFVFTAPSQSTLTLKVGVVNHDESNTPFNGSTLIHIMDSVVVNGTKMFKVKLYSNETSLVNDLKKNRIDVGIVIPDGFGRKVLTGQASLKVMVSGGSTYELQVNKAVIMSFINRLATEIALNKINVSLRYFKLYALANTTITLPWGNESLYTFVRDFMYGIATPINTTVETVAPKALVNRAFLIGWYAFGAIGMVMLYGGFIFGALTVTEELPGDRLRRILSTPVTETEFLVGKTISYLIILFLSAIVTIAVAIGIGARFTWSPSNPADWLVILHLVLIALMTIGIGFMLSLAAKTAKTASSLGTILGLLLAFITGIWFPKTWLPAPLKAFANAFPVTWSLDAVRDVILKGASAGDIAFVTVKCIIATIVIFAVGVISYKKVLRKYVEL